MSILRHKNQKNNIQDKTTERISKTKKKKKKSKSPDSADYLYICCIIFGIDRLYCTFCCGR